MTYGWCQLTYYAEIYHSAVAFYARKQKRPHDCLLTIKFDNKAARITIKFDNAWANNHFFLTSSFILDVKKDASAFRL